MRIISKENLKDFCTNLILSVEIAFKNNCDEYAQQELLLWVFQFLRSNVDKKCNISAPSGDEVLFWANKGRPVDLPHFLQVIAPRIFILFAWCWCHLKKNLKKYGFPQFRICNLIPPLISRRCSEVNFTVFFFFAPISFTFNIGTESFPLHLHILQHMCWGCNLWQTCAVSIVEYK